MTHPALIMYKYHVWANGVIIDRLKELPQDIYHKEIQSGFSSVSKVLSHIYLTDYAWFDIILGKSMNEAMVSTNQLREQVETKNIEEMKEMFQDLSERNKALLNSQEDIDKVIVVNNPYAGVLETSISESVLHVVTHGSYHRGNIATMLRQMGQTSVMQDFGLYLYSK
ncbi:DinB family protein [Bacillus wiedmannii]|uniref:Damage-inducible protein DinB n=1 Tax=Bacillus wiedmannii TaxID=1890302 RepID=A0A2C3YUU6_9BACI|nr:DinB family protein [Bacillus wiedmannii]PEA77465.1 damage-inducible protein DinB [Bacillus wiedmannii]PEI80412.1 damage-inducible protein DinB [Bacillus wiedmannii]PEN43515.1 damage-inducible protein DinB [Bacillus wiedmannii]PEN64695.1 damage-inducible protein DinB [Bacillus wiedmannii]PEO56471.1 damage-inducible protein DinB [Bacillus wiedmannii]